MIPPVTVIGAMAGSIGVAIAMGIRSMRSHR